MPNFRDDLKDKRFGRWQVLGFAEMNQRHKALWECRCDCGTLAKVIGANLCSGISLSCGCLRAEQQAARIAKQNWKHGCAVRDEFTPEYRTWMGMLARCERPSALKFAKYHAMMGVRVCDRWKESFGAFLQDMGPKPSPDHSIDRYPNNNGNYEPGNCRWATRREQWLNRRKKLEAV